MNQKRPGRFVGVAAEELYNLCKDKITYVGSEMWKFYSGIRGSVERDKAMILMHNSAFTNEKESGFQVHGLLSVPQDEIRRLSQRLPEDIDVSAEQTKTADGVYIVAFVFKKIDNTRDKSPQRPQKIDLKRTKKSSKVSISSSDSEDPKRLSRHSQSEDEGSPVRERFRRSKTPAKDIPKRSESRGRSISRESVVRMKPSEAAKLRAEMKDADLVEVVPLAPKKPERKKFLGVF